MYSTHYPPATARALAHELGVYAVHCITMVQSMTADAQQCAKKGFTDSQRMSEVSAHSWHLAAEAASRRAAHFGLMALDTKETR